MLFQTDLRSQLTNVIALVNRACPEVDKIDNADDLANQYNNAIYRLQGRLPLRVGRSVRWISDHDEAKSFCEELQKDALSLLDDKNQGSVILERPDSDAARKINQLLNAKSVLTQIAPDANTLFNTVITDVFVMPSHCARGGSTSSALGVIWANPGHHYSEQDILEFLIHELAHHTLFIDEILFSHYHYEAITSTRYWANSAILNTRRPIDKVLHSLIVALEILAFRERFIGHPRKPLVHPPSKLLELQARGALASLEETCKLANSEGAELLTARGSQLTLLTREFIDSLDIGEGCHV